MPSSVIVPTDANGFNGRWGFSVQAPVGFASLNLGVGISFADLLSLQVDVARVWTVHLSTMRYTVTDPAAPALDPGSSLDNQVDPFWQVNLVYGANDASERVSVDYPPRGATFQIHASNLHLSVARSTLVNAPFGQPPLFTGWISDDPRTVGALVSPTLTRAFGFLGTGAVQTVFIPIPERACAYRVRESDGNVTPLAANLGTTIGQSVNGTSLPTFIDYGPTTAVSVGVGGDLMPDNRAAYFPILATSQYLWVRVGAALVSTNLRFQFLLDLG
jgi:hypothetical protein